MNEQHEIPPYGLCDADLFYTHTLDIRILFLFGEHLRRWSHMRRIRCMCTYDAKERENQTISMIYCLEIHLDESSHKRCRLSLPIQMNRCSFYFSQFLHEPSSIQTYSYSLLVASASSISSGFYKALLLITMWLIYQLQNGGVFATTIFFRKGVATLTGRGRNH